MLGIRKNRRIGEGVEMKSLIRKVATATFAVALIAFWSGSAFADWTISDLGTYEPGGMSYATGINNNGQVVGWYSAGDTTTGTTAFIWQNGTMTSLGTMSGTSSVATGINSIGQVVGYAKDASGAYQAFVWNGVSWQTLTSPSNGSNSAAYAINSAGLVGGTGQTTEVDAQGKSTVYNAALWSGTTGNALSRLSDTPYSVWGGPVSEVYSINDSGVAVGKSSIGGPDGDDIGDPASHAVIWGTDGSLKDLGTIGTCSTVSGICTSAAFAVNNSGQIVGVSGDSTNTNLRPFIYTNGSMTDLGTLGTSTNGYALAINNMGQVVGYSSDFMSVDPQPGVNGSFTTATLWTINADGTASAIDLNSLVAGSGWELWGATGINDNGQIVGYGMLGEGADATFHAFLLTPDPAPVPLPPALFLFGSGLAGLIGFRRKISA
jgi:probable HAF family extracellular repeat protein